MEARSKAAAETAAVVPFHCVICFDSFCLRERLPVVLPCGHTFVCQPCSKRLKRCMECREPLFYSIPKTGIGGVPAGVSSHSSSMTTNRSPPPGAYNRTNNHHHHGAGRFSPTPSTPTQNNHAHPPHAVTQVPYPIPKNVVLIAMMEVAERQAKEKERLDDTNGSMDDEEEYDLNRIISGMATLSGPCGTYVVKDPEGLVLLTEYPNHEHFNAADNQEPPWLPSPQRNDGKDEGGPTDHVPPALSVSASEDSVEVKYPGLLEKGQTVQVVSFEHGVATLARRAGYILANSNQLVKVGGPREKSCRLEGILDTVIHRGKDLQKELDENAAIEESIRQEIETEFKSEPNYPVISEVPEIQHRFLPVSNKEARDPITPTGKSIDSASKEYSRTPDMSPDSGVIFNTIPEIAHPAATFPFSPHHSVDNNDLVRVGLPAYRRNASLEESFGCGATSFLGTSVGIFSSGEPTESPPRFSDGNENRLRSSSADGEGGANLMLTPTLTSSFDTIDFRTGMSGHRGLTNAKSNAAAHSPGARRSIMMMSEHRGIGRARGPLNRSGAPNTQSP